MQNETKFIAPKVIIQINVNIVILFYFILFFFWGGGGKGVGVTKKDSFYSESAGLNLSPGWGCRDGAVVRALASNQCGPGPNPRPGVICWLSLLVLYSAPRGDLFNLQYPQLVLPALKRQTLK